MTTAPISEEKPGVITSLPQLPNPAHPRNAGPLLNLHATEAMRVMRLLAEGASNGTIDYPYPTTSDYPLPPLPAVPVPSGALRRPRPAATKTTRPVIKPPIPSSSSLFPTQSLDEAIEAHNAACPIMPCTLHYGRSSLLMHAGNRWWCWALLRTLTPDDNAHEVKVISVRFFPTRDPRPPPVHALPPQGPSNICSESLTRLRLSVPELLFRMQNIIDLINKPCFYCGHRLSDLDGLPVGMNGYLPGTKKPANGSGSEEETTANGTKADDKEDTEGRWVSWHPRCEQ